MASVNKVTLLGRVGKDPEIRTFQSGGRVANFSVATSESWKDKSTGEKKEKVEWTNVSVFNDHLVTVVESYVKKGDMIYLEGQLETSKYTDKDGVERYTTKVILKAFNGVLQLLGGKKEQYSSEVSDTPHKGFTPTGEVAGTADVDSEIPF